MKKSQLKQLIKEISDNLAKDPNYVAGYRLGEKDGYVGEESIGLEHKPRIYMMGYKKGWWVGWRKRWSEKITRGAVAAGQYFGDTSFHRKF